VDNNLVFVLLVLLLAVIITIAILPSIRRRQRERDDPGYGMDFGGLVQDDNEESRKAQVALEELKRLERLDLHGADEDAHAGRDFGLSSPGEDDFLHPGALGPAVIRGHVAEEPPLPRRPEEPVGAVPFDLAVRDERAAEPLNGRPSGAGANGVAARQGEGRTGFDWKVAAQYERSRGRGMSIFDDPGAVRATQGDPGDRSERPAQAARAAAGPAMPPSSTQQAPPRIPPTLRPPQASQSQARATPPPQPRVPPPQPAAAPEARASATPPPQPRVPPSRQPQAAQPRFTPPQASRATPHQSARTTQQPVPVQPARAPAEATAQPGRAAASGQMPTPPVAPGQPPAAPADRPQPGSTGGAGSPPRADTAFRADRPAAPAPPPPPPPLSPPLITPSEADRFRDRWSSIKGAFPDDPHAAVRQARQLLEEFNELVNERLAVDKGDGEEPSTEELRIALRRYRAFFDRLLMA
jgi:hypothetical protein